MKLTTKDVGKLFLLLTAFLLDSIGAAGQNLTRTEHSIATTIEKEIFQHRHRHSQPARSNSSFILKNKSKDTTISRQYWNKSSSVDESAPIHLKSFLLSNRDKVTQVPLIDVFNSTIKHNKNVQTTINETETVTTAFNLENSERNQNQNPIQGSKEKSIFKQNQRRSLSTNSSSSAVRQQEKSSHQRKSDQANYTQTRQQQQQQQQQFQNVAVVMPYGLLDQVQVQEGFLNFVEFFQVGLKNIKVDFIRENDLSGFMKLLEHPKYTIVVKTLNTWINVDNGPADAEVFIRKNRITSSESDSLSWNKRTEQQEIRNKHFKNKTWHEATTTTTTTTKRIGYCCFEKELLNEFNKTVLLWPCPHMRESRSFLPSFEAISFAVKSIAAKLNWTEVDIFVGDDNWGLPLAIASNLHIPYNVRIGETSNDFAFSDKNGKAIIITTAINDDSTLRLLSQLKSLKQTKVLLIDIVAASLNSENVFYKRLRDMSTDPNSDAVSDSDSNTETESESESYLMTNLLLLTVLSDKYRHFLNIAYEDYDMKLVQDFRQTRRWRNQVFNRFNENDVDNRNSAENTNWWTLQQKQKQQQQKQQQRSANTAQILNGMINDEIHLNGTASKSNSNANSNSIANILNKCLENVDNKLNEICQSSEEILKNCLNFTISKSNGKIHNQERIQKEEGEKILISKFNSNELFAELTFTVEELCRLGYLPTVSSGNKNSMMIMKKEYEKKISSLRNFIDFFNFYDFLIANLLRSNIKNDTNDTTDTNANGRNISSSNASTETEQKYDFIVLDVVVQSNNNGSITDDSNNQNANVNSINTTHFHPNPHGDGDGHEHAHSYIHQTVKDNNKKNRTFKWRPLLILEQHEINLNTYITHSIQPGYDDWLLVKTVQFWQCGAICWTIIAICAGFLLIIIAASVAAGIAMRNYLLRQRLSKGPNKIVLSANDFVFPVDSRRVDEGIEAMLCCWLQQLQEFGGPEVDKPDLLKGSIGSLKNLGLIIPGGGVATVGGGVNNVNATANGKAGSGSGSLAKHNPVLLDMRARYNGDLVQLKEIPLNGSGELKSKAMDLLVLAHGLRHENINPLIGWLSDPNRTALVFDYCSRGSLQDVLIMDEIKLDWSFRLSLLTDLVRGMRYLHSSPLRVHGALTSRNCVVDARWVLKITDYGLPTFYEAQGLLPPSRSAKELLWTAPELLRCMKSNHHHHHHHHQHHHHHHYHGRTLATQMGDVYSFSIIMQEVVVRGEPYCMLSLSAEEIIIKIKKPPPLIRPSVSKGAAPPEAINIMRQCWAEQPDMRPDFNSVYERFKILNHGRKVNFVDTMFQMLEKYSNNLEELIRERTEQLDIERKKTEQLLNRMLPSSVAEKLKMGLAVDPEEFSDVTIYFSDIVGFTTIAAHCSPVQVVDLLNDLYTIFDATINAYNVYKVETIGDAYMVVSGLPVKIPDHAEQIATMALDLLHQSGRFNLKHLPGVPLQLRIGLHTGPCCAGVVGLTMPRYCLFGDTVNTASRMESTGSSWRIHMSQETRDRLEARGGYMIEPRGLIEIKGKGLMNTFWLLGKKGFDKPLPTPPPIGESHGLDESLIRNSITLKAQANKSRNSTNPSSSQSSSLAGESVEVKVEITPPTNADVGPTNLPNSYSLDSNSTTTISPNATLCPEFQTKTPSTSPQSRKMSELTPDNLLNPSNFNRLPNSAGGSSSRLYKKIEEMMDLSLPYNHYKCLSPSESNLTQFYDGKYLYSNAGIGGVNSSSAGCSAHSSSTKFDSKPGSSRLLRRQFSLDRDDTQSKTDHHHHHQHQHQQHHQASLQANYTLALPNKSSLLDVPILHDAATSRSPKGTLTRAHKQNSTSITQDLEKIEEIPLSPVSSQQHSSMDSNLNRSPPSTFDGHSPPSIHQTELIVTPPQMFSAPTSPGPSRSIDGVNIGITTSSVVENSNATDGSTTTTTTATTTESANSTPIEASNIRHPEITLNAAALLSR